MRLAKVKKVVGIIDVNLICFDRMMSGMLLLLCQQYCKMMNFGILGIAENA